MDRPDLQRSERTMVWYGEDVSSKRQSHYVGLALTPCHVWKRKGAASGQSCFKMYRVGMQKGRERASKLDPVRSTRKKLEEVILSMDGD